MSDALSTVWESLWGANPVSGRLIVLAILAVLAKAIFEGRRQALRYFREERELRRVSTWLEEWRAGATAPGGGAETAAAESEAAAPNSGEQNGKTAEAQAQPGSRRLSSDAPAARPGLADLDQLVEAADPSTLIGDRIWAIAKMRHYRVKIDLDTLQELAVYRDAAAPGHGFAGFAAGLCMLLGILGTFIGLSAMVQEIHLGLPTDIASLTLDSWLGSVQQLGAVLGGMKTAFSTSLVGMAGAIVASSLAFRIGHRRRAVFESLERLTAAELIPATVPSVEDEVLLAQVSRQLDDSFSRLDDIYRQNQAALEDLTAAQQAFVAIVGEVRDITRGQAARNLDAILGQVAQSSEAVLAVSRQIPSIVSAFETSARGLREFAGRLWTPVPASRVPAGTILSLRPATWLSIAVAVAVVLGLARLLDLF